MKTPKSSALASDLDGLRKVFIAQLNRFVQAGTLTILDAPPNLGSIDHVSGSGGLKRLTISLPINHSRWDIRESPPRRGIVFEDDSVLTALFIAETVPKDWEAGNWQPLKNMTSLFNDNGELWAVIKEYSYSFYPNIASDRAKRLGYFRYDFHPEKMGDGDLGCHPYFHLHSGNSGTGTEEQDDEIRMVTSLVNLGDVLAVCEHNLLPEKRQARLDEWFKQGKFEDLQPDLTPDGFQQLARKLFDKHGWKSFAHKATFEAFIKARGWKLAIW